MSKTYPLPNPTAVAAKIAAAGGPQINLQQPAGSAAGDGVKLSWIMTPGQVTISILSKPFYVSEAMVWSHLDPLFA